MARDTGDRGRATSGRHDLRVSRVRRRPTRGVGQRLIALRLRPLPTCRSRRTRAAIRDRSLVLRHRPAVPTARDRLGTARSRDRGRLCPRCSRGSRGILSTNPKRATQAISAARGPCTTHADSSRSRCGNVTQWCACRLFLLGYRHTAANATAGSGRALLGVAAQARVRSFEPRLALGPLLRVAIGGRRGHFCPSIRKRSSNVAQASVAGGPLASPYPKCAASSLVDRL